MAPVSEQSVYHIIGRQCLACEDFGTGADCVREEGGSRVALFSGWAPEGAVAAGMAAAAVARDFAAVRAQRLQTGLQLCICI